LRVFKTRWVARECRRFGIADAELMRVARQLHGGLGDDLGGGVWKKRLCNNTCRALLLAHEGRRLFFVYLFAKKTMDNIDRDELQRLRGLARLYWTYDTERLAQMLRAGSLLEIPMTASEKTQKATTPAADTVEQDEATYLVAGKLPRARSHLFEAIHSAAYDLFEAGGMTLVTMRGFDRACLSDIVLSPADIRAIREANRVSQAVFARCLGTSESTIKQWESGAKRPSGMARTLLHTIGKRGLAVLS
jgi:putative transcriptional regulator